MTNLCLHYTVQLEDSYIACTQGNRKIPVCNGCIGDQWRSVCTGTARQAWHSRTPSCQSCRSCTPTHRRWTRSLLRPRQLDIVLKVNFKTYIQTIPVTLNLPNLCRWDRILHFYSISKTYHYLEDQCRNDFVRISSRIQHWNRHFRVRDNCPWSSRMEWLWYFPAKRVSQQVAKKN